jgi:hypothetical protein
MPLAAAVPVPVARRFHRQKPAPVAARSFLRLGGAGRGAVVLGPYRWSRNKKPLEKPIQRLESRNGELR